MKLVTDETKVAVVGLGYVGLPLAIEFGKNFATIGFDISREKIEEFKSRIDLNNEVSLEDFKESKNIKFTNKPEELSDVDAIIVSVPTPVTSSKMPDMKPLESASQTIGQYMSKGTIIVYESTVYPGATEEVCIPILEKTSGMKWGEDFFVGYSPERINPGDKEKTLTKIIKVVSGDNENTLQFLSALYGRIISAGIFAASSIRVAEAAKVIENTQRDLNIALMNELSIIFNKLDINTKDVLEAAATKWNFLPFHPGLVGGHCIGVDPYYLTYKAKMIGYHPEVILAGRKINDEMPSYLANLIIKKLVASGLDKSSIQINILGMTFKENCPDLRNSKVLDLALELQNFGVSVACHDSEINYESTNLTNVDIREWKRLPRSNCLILASPHNSYLKMKHEDLISSLLPGGLIVDLKSKLNSKELDARANPVIRL